MGAGDVAAATGGGVVAEFLGAEVERELGGAEWRDRGAVRRRELVDMSAALEEQGGEEGVTLQRRGGLGACSWRAGA